MFSSLRQYFSRYSENIGGGVSFVGSTIPALNGDTESLVAAGLFAGSEITFMRAGHKTEGYSLGAAGLCGGDFVLACSDSVSGNPALQASLLAMAAVWGVAATRYPIEAMGFNRVAGAIPPVTGAASLSMRVPGIMTAAGAGNYPVMVAIGCWAISDVLCGRLQNVVDPLVEPSGRYLLNNTDPFYMAM